MARPDIGSVEIDLVNQVLRSDFLSLGQMVQDFERALAGYVGSPHAVAVSSGTAGLHALIRAYGIGPGDEVFVDVESESLGLDPELVEAAITPRTRAILAIQRLREDRHIDCSLARDELGFSPRSFHDGILRAVDLLRRAGVIPPG